MEAWWVTSTRWWEDRLVTEAGSGPVVQIHLLGGVTVATDDGAPVDVGPAKCRAVLAALALSVGESVSVARLVDVVWGEDAPRTADKTLQGYVAGLRRSLGSDAIVRVGAAYRLDVAAHAVDVCRFRRHVAAGEIDAALAEWRGAPLAGLDAPGLDPVVDGLVEQWLGAVEVDLQRRVGADPPAAVATLTQLTAEHPFREELWALLMTALYRSGRQAEALAAYRRARQHLVEELGVEPGARLREMERLVLEHDERLHAKAPATEPADEFTVPLRGSLPARPDRLFGRDGDLRAVAEAVDASAVVTLVGPGGIGKTALALAAARRRQGDGVQRVCLVELGEIAGFADVPRAVADALGVIEGSAGTLTDSVVAALRSRPTLLVLDNCEHVIDGAALLASAVADHAPNTRVLATSRARLGITGEQVVAVGALDVAGAAVELFAERARAASQDFDLDDSASEVAEICRRLDGVPLAIELAAARTRSLTATQLLARLDDRLRLLTSGDRAGADRHRTLRSTIGWSYDLLSPDQRVVFQRLSAFTGPFDLAAAEAVATSDDLDTIDVDHLLGDLVDRSMVTPEPGPFGRRFRLLETLRHFAAEQLAAHGDHEVVARRHAWWCRDQVAHISRLLSGTDEVEGVARLAELWPNLRTAVVWACSRGDAALADALVRPVAPEANLRRRAEISDWADRILELIPAGDEDEVVFWLAWAANRHMQASDHEAYDRLVARHGHTDHPLIRYTRSYLYEDDDDVEASLAAVDWLRERDENRSADLVEVAGAATQMMTTGRLAELDALAGTMEDRYRAHGPPTMLYFALGLLALSAQFQGRHADAARFFAESAAIDVPAGTYLVNRTVEARALFDQGARPRAFTILRDHVDELLETDYVDVARMVAIEFVYMATAVNRLTDAARVLTYLDTTGGFGVLARNTLLADAVHQITAAPDIAKDDGRELDARQALAYMRQVLDELAV